MVDSGGAAGASVYSNFILTESHKPHRIRQANRIKNNRRRSPRADGSGRGHVESVRNSLGKDPGKRKAATDYVTVAEQKIECLTYAAQRQLSLSLSDSRRRRYPWRVRFFFGSYSLRKRLVPDLIITAQLVVNDSRATPRDGVRVTYLGTNGYQFEFKGHALLVDPYFSRVDLLSVALGSRIQPDASRINDGLSHLAPKADAILVTHGHFDHLLDVPAVMAKTRARLVASASSVDLAKRAGASSGDAVKPGDVRRIGPWKIRVLSATHDRLFGKVPFDRPPSQAGLVRRSLGEGWTAATRCRLDLRGTACVFDRGERPAHLHRLRRNTGAVAA